METYSAARIHQNRRIPFVFSPALDQRRQLRKRVASHSDAFEWTRYRLGIKLGERVETPALTEIARTVKRFLFNLEAGYDSA